MNDHMCGYSSFSNRCSRYQDKPVKKSTMTVTVSRPNVTIIYKNVIKIDIQDDGSVRMINKDDEIFVTKGKYEIAMEE